MPHSTARQESPAGEVEARNADAALLDALVREHRDAAVAYATRILGDAHLAEDAVQRALLQILVRVRGGDDQLLAVNPRAVVLRGTRWAALKLAERSSSRGEAERRAAHEALGSADDHDWDRLEARMLVQDILPSLPEHYRDVLRLRYLEGQPDVSAAADLAVTLKAYRRRLDRALAVARVAALRIGVTSLGAALLDLLRRARGRVQRVLVASQRGAWSPVGAGSPTCRASLGHIALAVALVGLVVGTPVLHRGGAPGTARSGGRGPVGGPAIAAAGAPAAMPAGPRGVTLVAAPSPQRAALTTQARASLADLDSAEVVAAPDAARNHTVVADGHGQRCNCHELMQTTDGGATWTSYPAPEAAGILLPPDYPRDPRIFFMYSSRLQDVGLCVEARISDGACTADPRVPSNAGAMVLDPGFDAGHPIMYISTPGGVLAYNDATGTSRPLELNTSADVNGPPIAAASGAGPYAVYVLVTGTPLPQGMTVTREAPSAAAPLVGALHLVGCRHDGSCATLADWPGDVTTLVAGRDDPSGSTVVGLGTGRLVVTTDAGATQRIVALPASAMVTNLQAIGSGAQVQVIAELVSQDSQHWRLGTWQAATGWLIRSMGAIAPAVSAPIEAPLGNGRVIIGVASAQGGGVYCTADGGLHWSPLCSRPA